MNPLEIYGSRKEVSTLSEQKEKPEVSKFRKLCIDYHKRDVSKWNMRSYEKDKGLYERFRKINVGLLPEPLRYIYAHRFAYVTAITKLGDNKKIQELLNEYSIIKLTSSNYQKIYKNPKFKALSLKDLNDALLALKASLQLLSAKQPAGSWVDKARKLLEGDTIDDATAGPRLKRGLTKVFNKLKKIHTIKSRSKGRSKSRS